MKSSQNFFLEILCWGGLLIGFILLLGFILFNKVSVFLVIFQSIFFNLFFIIFLLNSSSGGTSSYFSFFVMSKESNNSGGWKFLVFYYFFENVSDVFFFISYVFNQEYFYFFLLLFKQGLFPFLFYGCFLLGSEVGSSLGSVFIFLFLIVNKIWGMLLMGKVFLCGESYFSCVLFSFGYVFFFLKEEEGVFRGMGGGVLISGTFLFFLSEGISGFILFLYEGGFLLFLFCFVSSFGGEEGSGSEGSKEGKMVGAISLVIFLGGMVFPISFFKMLAMVGGLEYSFFLVFMYCLMNSFFVLFLVVIFLGSSLWSGGEVLFMSWFWKSFFFISMGALPLFWGGLGIGGFF